MSSLIPFTPDFGQPANSDAASDAGDDEGAAAQVWTPEKAQLRDLDATGVTAALAKLLAQPSIVTELRNRADVTRFVRDPGDRLVLIGGAPWELGGSVFLEVIHGVKMGGPPVADAAVEKKLQKIVHTLVEAKIATAVRGLAGGGLLVALAEMLCGPRPCGARLDLTAFGATRSDVLLFGESRGRVIVAVRADRVGTVLSESHTGGVPAAVIGEITDEPELVLFTRRLSARWPIATLREVAGLPAGSEDAESGAK